MKLPLLFAIFISSSLLVLGQDNLFLINNFVPSGGSAGITKVSGINPSNATGGTVTTYATGDNTTLSAAMAMSANGKYLYYIEQQANNQGEFVVRSIPAYPHPDFPTAPTAGTPQSPTAPGSIWDMNGASTNNVFFRRLGIAADGWAYMIQTQDLDGEIYLSRFKSYNDGTASDFQKLGTITLDGVAKAPNFNNGDLVLDGNGSMYILVNEDGSPGAASIYYLPAATLNVATASPSASHVTNIVTKYVVLNETGGNFNSPVVGLALSSTGTFYVAVQSNTGDGGIYYINSGVQNGKVIIKGPSSALNAANVADLTTNYFPNTTVLPVTFGSINAQLDNNSLVVNWSTFAETNNSHFDIEVSKDGNSFTKIGSVDTKAINGNSDKTIQYDFSKSINDGVGLLGLSLLSLSFLLLFMNRKNKMLLAVMVVMGVGLMATSCTKSNGQIDVENVGKLFVKIVQVDINGKRSESEVVTAYKPN